MGCFLTFIFTKSLTNRQILSTLDKKKHSSLFWMPIIGEDYDKIFFVS